MNEQQLQVVAHRGCPLLVFAAAGTGKTQALTARIASLVLDDRVDPERILALTFTNKAAAEMRKRSALQSDLPEAAFRNVSTFHSLCLRLLRDLDVRYDILDPKASSDLMALVAVRTLDMALELGFGNEGLVSALREEKDLGPIFLRAISDRFRNHGHPPPDSYPATLRGLRTVRDLAGIAFKMYRVACVEQGVADFDDMILHVLTELEKADVRRRISAKYDHYLVDEFQDTNGAQMLLLKRLCDGDFSNVMVVGDDYQAIHEWRGATVRNILDFELNIPETRVVHLVQNYRSRPSILLAAQRIIDENLDQVRKRIEPTRGAERVEVRRWRPWDDKAEALRAVSIAERLDEGERLCVLFRGHARSYEFEAALKNAGIRYIVHRSTEFFKREEVLVMLSYLSAALALESRRRVSNVDSERIFNEPPRGLGDRSRERVLEEQGNFFEVCCRFGKTEAKFERFVKLVREFATRVHSTDARAFLEMAFERSGYKEHLELLFQGKLANVAELIELAADRGPREFLDHCRMHDVEQVAGPAVQVYLMTMHASKGLEFEQVFVSGCVEGLFPDPRSPIAEERRLCYVAFTRARDVLHLSAPRLSSARGVHHGPQGTQPSRFLGGTF